MSGAHHTGSDDTEYRLAHLRDRLADDEVGELGLRIELHGTHVTVRGTVPNERRRAAVQRIVAEVLDGLKVHTDIVLADDRPPTGAEDLP
ncbi:BON domain-containing protein [Kitasatospora sp. NPDC101157]|uniref:BON domain-containing protein n=1 Tax=Kitasatospora sp. NPDC101157 TaxID=3364098 RepID=UPI0038132E2F